MAYANTALSHPSSEPQSFDVMIEQNSTSVIQSKQVQLTINTRIGEKAFNGKNNLMGIKKFAASLRQIKEASEHDNPYADLFLIRIYDAVYQARKKLKKQLDIYCKLMTSASPGISIHPFLNKAPLIVPLYFSTPYAFSVTYLLADFDQLAHVVITLLHTALLSKKETRDALNEARAEVVSVLSTVNTWPNIKISRVDYRQNTEAAQKLKDLLGEIPEPILNGQVSPPW